MDSAAWAAVHSHHTQLLLVVELEALDNPAQLAQPLGLGELD